MANVAWNIALDGMLGWVGLGCVRAPIRVDKVEFGRSIVAISPPTNCLNSPGANFAQSRLALNLLCKISSGYFFN